MDEVRESVEKLSTDLKRKAQGLSKREARFLVDTYHQMQDQRIRSGNQLMAIGDDQPNEILHWLMEQNHLLESRVKAALKIYAEAHLIGQWMLDITGVGPVITASMLAYIDIERAPTVGHIWRFAGLDPSQKWLGTDKAKKLVKETWPRGEEMTPEIALAIQDGSGVHGEKILIQIEDGATREEIEKFLARRHWNANLKKVCWQLGQSFKYTCNSEASFYGPFYKARKAREQMINARGGFSETASQELKIKRYGKTTAAYKAYAIGKLPDARIQARACRWTTKLFLSHLHHVWYLHHYNEEPPKPYAMAMLEHGHYIAPPGLK